MPGIDPVDADKFAEQLSRYPVPLDRQRVENLGAAYRLTASMHEDLSKQHSEQTARLKECRRQIQALKNALGLLLYTNRESDLWPQVRKEAEDVYVKVNRK